MRAIYKEHGISFKKLKLGKLTPADKLEEYDEQLQVMRQKIRQLQKEHYDILWLDEIMFTSKTQVDKAFSPKK